MISKLEILIGLTIFEGALVTFMGLVPLGDSVGTTAPQGGFGGFVSNLVTNFSALGPFAWLSIFFLAVWGVLVIWTAKDLINPLTASP